MYACSHRLRILSHDHLQKHGIPKWIAKFIFFTTTWQFFTRISRLSGSHLHTWNWGPLDITSIRFISSIAKWVALYFAIGTLTWRMGLNLFPVSINEVAAGFSLAVVIASQTAIQNFGTSIGRNSRCCSILLCLFEYLRTYRVYA